MSLVKSTEYILVMFEGEKFLSNIVLDGIFKGVTGVNVFPNVRVLWADIVFKKTYI